MSKIDCRLSVTGYKTLLSDRLLVRNLKRFMEGAEHTPDYIDVSFNTLAEFWRERWLIPRSERVDGWHDWKPEEIKHSLFNGRG